MPKKMQTGDGWGHGISRGIEEIGISRGVQEKVMQFLCGLAFWSWSF